MPNLKTKCPKLAKNEDLFLPVWRLLMMTKHLSLNKKTFYMLTKSKSADERPAGSRAPSCASPSGTPSAAAEFGDHGGDRGEEGGTPLRGLSGAAPKALPTRCMPFVVMPDVPLVLSMVSSSCY